MVKNIIKIKRPKKESKDASLEKIKKMLSDKHACYVLITCSEPSVRGTMEVEMTYEVFDEKISHRKSK